MAKTMTASMTDGQIENVVDKFRAVVRKHRGEFNSEAVQQVLGLENLGMELLAPFRKHVEAMSNVIVHCVKVDRTRTPQQVLDATGREQYTARDVVAGMPRGEGEEAEVVFFNLGRYVSDEGLRDEYTARGLKPADTYSLAKVNEDDASFADTHPNSTHWRDANGKRCFAAFHRRYGWRYVRVYRRDDGWHGDWWFAGLRK